MGGVPAARLSLRNTLLFCAVGFAFSPVIVDLAQHLVAEPWSRYSAIFLPLAVLAAAREENPSPANPAGYAWLAVGLGITVVAVAAGEVRLGRVGLALGMIGFCRARGLASLRTLLLALWILPVPRTVASLGSPEVESLYLRFATWVPNLLGAEIAVNDATARIGGAILELSNVDNGLPLAALLSGLGWYAALRARPDLPSSLVRTLRWGCLGFAAQLLGVTLAVGSLLLGAPWLGRLVLAHLLWVATAALGLFRATRSVCASSGEALSVSPRDLPRNPGSRTPGVQTDGADH